MGGFLQRYFFRFPDNSFRQFFFHSIKKAVNPKIGVIVVQAKEIRQQLFAKCSNFAFFTLFLKIFVIFTLNALGEFYAKGRKKRTNRAKSRG